MDHTQYKKKFVWTPIIENTKLGSQCVAQVKHYAKEVFWKTLLSFWGSALIGWNTWSPFSKDWTRVIYEKGMIPSVWDIIFFDFWTKYGHVAVVDTWTTGSKPYVIEQNMWDWDGKGDGDGSGSDDYTRLWKYSSYKNVLGWYTLHPQEVSEDLSPSAQRAKDLWIWDGLRGNEKATRKEVAIMCAKTVKICEGMVR